MAQSSNVAAGQDANATQYNNLRADVFGAHHSDALGTLLVNADISPTAGIAVSKLAALTASRALVTDGSGVIVVSAVTAVELGYLAGIVSKPVANSGDETVAGIKTFGSIPVLPASDPTTDNQAARKAYADKFAGWKKIYDNELSAQAQNIDITGLDLDTDKAYMIIFNGKQGAAGGNLSLYVNADYTATNYYVQTLRIDGATVSGARVNTGNIIGASTNANFLGTFHMVRRSGENAYMTGQITNINAASLMLVMVGWTHNVVGNVTSIRLGADVANFFGIGTRIMIFKVVS